MSDESKPRAQPSMGPVLKYTVREKFDAVDFDSKETRTRVGLLELGQAKVQTTGNIAKLFIGAVIALAIFGLHQCGERASLEIQVKALQTAVSEHKETKPIHQSSGLAVDKLNARLGKCEERVRVVEKRLRINR